MQEQPFFSVIICTYNRKNLVRRAIDSLINQEEKDWEAVIVDDGSSDDTLSFIKHYLDFDRRFSYIYHGNKGQAQSKNDGIAVSIGKYITFLDSDDEYKSEHLSFRKKILTEQPDIELLHGGVEIIGNPYVPDFNDSTRKIHLSECVIGGTFFIKREAMMRINGFSLTKYGEDKLLFDKALELGLNILKTDFPTYIYHREGTDSICDSIGVKKIHPLR
ncbi:MAG: hypothetical protein QG635_757 [Bacteroidota bacterium]|nr:hypothetical protein [Bacteroidota bacterium]